MAIATSYSVNVHGRLLQMLVSMLLSKGKSCSSEPKRYRQDGITVMLTLINLNVQSMINHVRKKTDENQLCYMGVQIPDHDKP